MISSLPKSNTLDQAGHWLLHSGIQEISGGVARYHRTDTQTNLPVSSEITGYASSTFAFLYERTGNPDYQIACHRAAAFLSEQGWDAANSTFPFEPGSDRGYFFDLGIIARGLMAATRVTGDASFHERAKEAALSLAFDYLGDNEFYPIIILPEKQPLPPEPRWSRQPGCFQLKAALIWKELGDPHAARMFETALALGLATHETFLPAPQSAEAGNDAVMDRLHAYCYFLEALLSSTEHPEVRQALTGGIHRVAALLREIAPRFERSDVCAQLLRVRLIAHHLHVVALDQAAAEEEALRSASYQITGPASQLHQTGGFWFGRKDGNLLPFSNPVSTGFCLQALALWDDHRNNCWNFTLSQLI